MGRMLSEIFKSGIREYELLTTTAKRPPATWSEYYSALRNRRRGSSMQQPQPETMNRNKIRRYPPMIVCAATAIAFAVAGIATINQQATAFRAGELPHSVITPHTAIFTETDYPARVTLTQQPQPAAVTYNESLVKSRDFDAADSEMLLKIAMAEAEGESVEGKALVMMVVLNRVWSESFPDTVQEVIFQPRQFSVMVDGGRYWTTEPDAGCYEALELVMQGWDESEGALYFESCEGSSWHSDNLEYLFQVGNHKFYR